MELTPKPNVKKSPSSMSRSAADAVLARWAWRRLLMLKVVMEMR